MEVHKGTTMRVERDWLGRVEAFFAVIANVAIVAALGVAYWSYQAQVSQSRSDAAFYIVAGLNEGKLSESQRRLASEIGRSEIGNLRNITVPRETMVTFIEQIVETSGDPREIRQDIIAIISYFDTVKICVESGTCNQEIVTSHLLEPASRYACLLIPYTDSIREDLLFDGLGDGLSALINYEKRC